MLPVKHFSFSDGAKKAKIKTTVYNLIQKDSGDERKVPYICYNYTIKCMEQM